MVVRSYNWVGVSPDTSLALALIITVRTSAANSLLEGELLLYEEATTTITGAEMLAAVPSDLKATAYDTNGLRLTSGGSNVFTHVEELCYVTDNYRCDRAPDTPDVLNGTQYLRMIDAGDGTYSTTVDVKRPGQVTLSVVLTKVGGFYGEYFNNAFLDGVPAKTQVDSYLDFNWDTGFLTDEAADFVSVQWFGKIRAPYTEEFTFILSADDGVRMYIDGDLVVDRWDTCCDDVSYSMDMVMGVFYDTVIEYKEHQEGAHLKLEWVSLSLPREVVPPTRVYYPERITPGALTLEVLKGPSIATQCSSEGEALTRSTAGKRAYFYVQSRDWDGIPLDNPDDAYEIVFTGPDEGTPAGEDGVFSVDASYVSNGL